MVGLRVLVIAVIGMFLVGQGAYAQQGGGGGGAEIRVDAGVSSTSVSLGDTVIYQITVEGAAEAKTPAIPASGAYSAQFMGGQNLSNSFTMVINGQAVDRSTKRYVMRWRVTPTAAGAASIGPLTVEAGGRAVLVPQVHFNVVESVSNPMFPLRLECERDVVYVGEPVRMRLVWTVGGRVSSAAFSGPDGGEVYDILALDPRPAQVRAAAQQGQESNEYPGVPFLSGTAYLSRSTGTLPDGAGGTRSVTALVMDVVITPREAGTLAVGPYRVVYDQVTGERQRSFMDMGDRYVTQRGVSASEPVTLEVRALPSEGRPSNFNGLIGEYRVEAETDVREANVGDPIPLRLTIRGPEPMGRIDPPSLERQEGFAAMFKAAPEGWEKPVGAADDAEGARSFTTTVRPRSADVTAVPPIELPYFDTKTGKYAVARSEPLGLKVSAVKQVTAADAMVGSGVGGEGVSGLRLPMSGGTAATLSDAAPGVGANVESLDALIDQRVSVLGMLRTPVGMAAAVLPPVMLGLVVVAGKIRRSMDERTAARRAAIGEARGVLRRAATSAEVGKAVRIAVAAWVGVNEEVVTASDVGRAAGELSEEVVEEAAGILGEVESAAYDGAKVEVGDVKGRAEELLKKMGREI